MWKQQRTYVRPPACHGFTLVELLVTVAVLAVVLALAVPSFQGVINRNRVTTAANELASALQLARVEAVRRNRAVVLCPSTDGTSCAGADWSRLVIFVDANGDRSPGGDDDELVRDVVVDTGDLVVQGSSNVAGNNRIWFAADGLVRMGAAAVRTGGVSVCSTKLPAADNTRDVLVAVSRINVASRAGTAECRARQD
jgi:prepilin-type N-terminal cleavage/methylation domain